jgi:type IV secretory pathway VirB2 component (pilin)
MKAFSTILIASVASAIKLADWQQRVNAEGSWEQTLDQIVKHLDGGLTGVKDGKLDQWELDILGVNA